MAEGRRDRSGRRRRRRSGGGGGGGHRASSDSELAGGGGRGGQQKWFFHEGLDVDQLARYRRRRCAGQPRDHLGPTGTEEAEDHQLEAEEAEDEEDEETAAARRRERGGLVTEYRLAFQCASSDDIFRASQDLLSPIRRKRHVGDSSFDQKNTDENSVVNPRASDNVPLLTLNNNQDTTKDEEWTKIMEMGTDNVKRPPLIRRPTTLRNEGEFSRSTEYSAYVPYPGHQRTELRRRGTSLRMEGDFESRTEKDDKYVEWPVDACRRPELARLPTHLRLEGELETSTESHDKYVPFVGARRPDILRQSAHLKLEGDSNWTPEYTDVFREFDCVGRRAAKKPESNLKPGGGFFDKTESKDHLTNPRDKEFELMEELAKDAQEEEDRKKKEEEEEEERKRLQKEEEMKLLVSKFEDLKSPLEVPEYKDAYKDFPRERPRLMKPEDEIGRADGSKVSNASPSHTRFKTKIDQDPEYKSIYLHDHNRGQLPVCHRPPPMSLRSSSRSSSIARAAPIDNNNYYRRDSRRFDPPTSEIRSQYVNYGQMPRVETLRMPANLRLEGNMGLEPEYRTAYRGYQHRNSSLTRRPHGYENNHWLDNDVGDHFGAVNAADEQDAFQVLHTRVHEESVVGKPPPGSRRSSRHPDITLTADRSAPLAQPRSNRSPSPSTTYRLQVSHADDEPRGFARRRRSPVQNLNVHPSSDRSPSPIMQAPAERPYSPSFARENSAIMRQQQSFVVLDNREAEEVPRRRRPDRNYDPMESLAGMRGSNGNAVRPRNRSPSNWMPPWYDSSTSTI